MSHRARAVLIDGAVVAPVLAWGACNRRGLPWRHTRDPWAVLVSEVMLQQTQVSRVIDRYGPFLERFPSPSRCAEASAADVIGVWSGMGYNRRAVNLWRAASCIVTDHGGAVPSELDALLALPGIGPYTARAVLVFAFERPVGVVDTNVGRLLARWAGHTLTGRDAQAAADALVPPDESWSWNQTLFDLASAICLRRAPSCGICPVRDACAWAGNGPDPADGTAGVARAQSRFEGSDRQVRGRIVEALRSGPVERGDLVQFMSAGHDEGSLDRIVHTLVTDGLVEFGGTCLRLAAKA